MTLSIVVSALLSAAVLYLTWRSRAQFLALPELPFDDSGPEIDHIVVIPARNEAAVIQRVVASLPGSTVLVVDDHSADETLALAREAGAHGIESDALPKHWLGKANACWTGAQRSESKWILFVDADTWYEPGFVKSLLNYAEKNDLQAVTCFPKQVYGSAIEKLLMPYALGLYFTGVNARHVNNPLKADALANGQCLMIRRDAYAFLGGHRSVAMSVIEDIALARRIKQHRMRVHVLRAENLARARMYEDFGALRHGLEKGFFRFLQANPKIGLAMVLASNVMISWLPVLLWLAYDRLWGAVAGFALLPAIAWVRWYGSPVRTLGAPVAIYLFQIVVLSGLFKNILGVPAKWKGRRIA